jgi:hypothetical protein
MAVSSPKEDSMLRESFLRNVTLLERCSRVVTMLLDGSLLAWSSAFMDLLVHMPSIS